MKKVRFGVLSTAGIAQTVLIPALKRSLNAEVTAIASSSGLEKAHAVASEHDIAKVYDGYEKVLDDPDIDAVYIPLPNHLHKQWVIEAAKKGKHILCEKPAALNEAEVWEMKQACEAHQVLFMEAFMYQFHPQHDRVRELIDTGFIGEVRYMQGGFTFLMPEEDKAHNIRMSREKGGGSLYDVGCYPIHAVRSILREEPIKVSAQATVDPTYQVDTDMVAHLTFANGVRATIDASFSLAMRHEYRVFGTEGSITVPRAYRPDINGGEGLIIIEKAGSYQVETIQGDIYRSQVEHFADAILQGRSHNELKQTFTDTIQTVRLIDACYESIQTKKAVNLKND